MKRSSKILIGVFGTLLAMQAVQCQRTNPPITGDLDAPADVKAVLHRACYDCHSNETEWPVYSYVAPMSWLVRRDVEEGREALNFSTWDQGEQEADDGADEIEDGSMPPSQYTRVHGDADLSADEQQVLIEALEEMGEGGDDHSGRGRGGDDEDRSGSNSGPG